LLVAGGDAQKRGVFGAKKGVFHENQAQKAQNPVSEFTGWLTAEIHKRLILKDLIRTLFREVGFFGGGGGVVTTVLRRFAPSNRLSSSPPLRGGSRFASEPRGDGSRAAAPIVDRQEWFE
jgi:hypothetical protein